MCFEQFSKDIFKSLRFLVIYGALLFMVIVNFTVLPVTKDQSPTTSTAQLPFCFENGTTSLVDEGDWVPLPGLTEKDYRERAELDLFIRRANEWAPILHRQDLRCGKNVPIPGYRLFSQCNAEGQSPCCNLNTGSCGKGAENCNCENCTDFRKMISAELAQWQTRKCQLRRFHWKDSCSLISRQNISLVFIGDSLIRHLHTATLLHLTNDHETGAIPQNASDKDHQRCSGVLQIVQKECSLEVATQNVDELRPDTVCTGFTPKKFIVDLVQDYHSVLLQKVRDKINSVLNQENTWLILGVGLHYQLEMDSLKREYLDKVFEILSHSANGWPKVLWIELHAFSGYIRQVAGPTMKKIEDFNELVEKYLEKRGAKVIKTFAMTKNVKSYDGRHHGLGLNLFKVDLIMNYLDQFYRKNRKSS